MTHNRYILFVTTEGFLWKFGMWLHILKQEKCQHEHMGNRFQSYDPVDVKNSWEQQYYSEQQIPLSQEPVHQMMAKTCGDTKEIMLRDN
jgi:hypothetical protein